MSDFAARVRDAFERRLGAMGQPVRPLDLSDLRDEFDHSPDPSALAYAVEVAGADAALVAIPTVGPDEADAAQAREQDELNRLNADGRPVALHVAHGEGVGVISELVASSEIGRQDPNAFRTSMNEFLIDFWDSATNRVLRDAG